MKQIVALLLVLALLFTLAACGEKEQTEGETTTTTTTLGCDTTTTESGSNTTTTSKAAGTTTSKPTTKSTTQSTTTTTTKPTPTVPKDKIKAAARSIFFYQQFFNDRLDLIGRTDFSNIDIETVFDFTYWYVENIYQKRAEKYVVDEQNGIESLTIKVAKANAIAKSVFGHAYDYKTLGARTGENDELWYDAATDCLRYERFCGGLGDQPMYRYEGYKIHDGNYVDVTIAHLDWETDPENGAVAFTYTLKLKYADEIFQILSFKKD